MNQESSKLKKIVGGTGNIVLLTDGFRVYEANRPFFRFFGVESLEAFHQRYRSLAETVERMDAYGYLNPGEGEEAWLPSPSASSEGRYRIKLRGAKESRIFALEVAEVEEGKNARSVLYLTDITDIEEYKFRLRYSNQRLREYLKNLDAADIVTRTTPDGIITYANDRFLEVSGYRREQVIGKTHRIIRHPDVPPALFEDMWRTILAGKIWQGRIINRRRDGGHYVVDATIGPIFDTQGKIVEFIGIRHDVTELVEAKERAQRAELAKTLFFANLSHEIRTPLNAILGFTSLLRRRKDLPDEVKKMVDIIDESGGSLLQIVNNILDLSKFEQGHLDVELRPISLDKMVRKTVALFEARAREKGVDLRLQIASLLPPKLLADRHRLRQVLSNLISNGIKFTPSGGEVLVRVEAAPEADRIWRVRFEVVDSGIGIPPEVQAKIFKPFEQAESSTERRYGGTGLGLPICARIVEALGGELTLESRVGEGSRFAFELEFREAGPEDGISPCEEEHDEAVEEARFSGEVLLAEDQPFNQELIRAFLKRFGLDDIEIVNDGKAALERMKRHRYDLVFLDIEMPGMRGDEVLRRWREDEEMGQRHQHIVALTAHADEKSLRYFLEIGFDEVVVKPVTDQALKEVLSRYMRTEEYGKGDQGGEKSMAFRREMVRLFLSGMDEEIEKMEALAASKRWVELAMEARRFQGAALGAGLDAIAGAAAGMTEERSCLDEDEILKALERLHEEARRIRTERKVL